MLQYNQKSTHFKFICKPYLCIIYIEHAQLHYRPTHSTIVDTADKSHMEA